MLYECPTHGLLTDEDVHPGRTRDEGYCMKCWCGRPVSEFLPETLPFEWRCSECGWSGFDPEVELRNGRLIRVCPICEEPE